MNVRHPVWLSALARPGAQAFALLFALESAARAILATVIPLQVLEAAGSPEYASLVFFAVSLGGLLSNFAIPALARHLSRRFTYSLGAVALLLAAASLSHPALATTMAGMLLRTFAAACFAICLNLYILDYLRGQELNRLEPLRLFLASFAWALGPWLGVFLWTKVHPLLPFAVSGAAALLVLAYFWTLRAGENRIIVRAKSPPPSPLKALRSYFAQPRLRLAWFIVLIRSSWWSMFFSYGPIFAVEAGLGREAAGLIVSAGNALLFTAPLLGLAIRRWGVRRTIVGAFLASGALTLAAAALARPDPVAAAVLLVAASLPVCALDAAGNLPFLRSVRPSQRAPMTMVFMTYRDASEILPPGVFAVLLKALPLPFVFVASGLSMLAMVRYARFLPRRL